MNRNRGRIAALAISLTILSCTLPTGADQQGIALTITALNDALQPASATPPPTASALPTLWIIPTAGCSPSVTAAMNANVRRGPSRSYEAVGYLLKGDSAPLAGRNSADTWWYIDFNRGPGGHAWIAKSVTTAACLPAVVPVVKAPPLPSTATPKPFKFAVTRVAFEVTGSCPNFHIKFRITVNGAGTVTYRHIWSGGAAVEPPQTLEFGKAGTKVGGDFNHYFGTPGGSGWLDIYVDEPNHQQFGRADFSCPLPNPPQP